MAVPDTRHQRAGVTGASVPPGASLPRASLQRECKVGHPCARRGAARIAGLMAASVFLVCRNAIIRTPHARRGRVRCRGHNSLRMVLGKGAVRRVESLSTLVGTLAIVGASGSGDQRHIARPVLRYPSTQWLGLAKHFVFLPHGRPWSRLTHRRASDSRPDCTSPRPSDGALLAK